MKKDGFNYETLSDGYKSLYLATGCIDFLTASLNIQRTKTPIELDPLNITSLDDVDAELKL